MKGSRHYDNAKAFRKALEDRLAAMAKKEGVDIQRLRRQVAFDRLLSRFFVKPESPWILKGGYALQLRMKASRTTRDVDLAIRDFLFATEEWEKSAQTVLELLQKAVEVDCNDFFVFTINLPVLDLDAAPYGGARYPVDANMDGRNFVKFHLDVSAGDVLREPYTWLGGRDWLGFAGIPTRKFPTITAEEHFAEKLHAYTLPRSGRPNSRVKDLVDMVLLIERGHLDPAGLVQSIQSTFRRRKTHEMPSTLSLPPVFWEKPFSEMAAECGVDPNIRTAFNKVKGFLEGILLLKPV
ncbi:MAG: nucleotidyl transferase AbiEii/AbiGii toxin family protein [Verrucomicrobiae bacterium]|nr:nucleotidyl transferase AbiEii/AbiGii toxin family protein [Verrucomicrobiae bacterium]